MKKTRFIGLLLTASLVMQGTSVYANEVPAPVAPASFFVSESDIAASETVELGDINREETAEAVNITAMETDTDPETGADVISEEESANLDGTSQLENEYDQVDITQGEGAEEVDITQESSTRATAPTLTGAQLEEKAELREHLGELRNLREGEDYVAGQIMVMAEDEETALLYAQAFDGEPESYDPDAGIAIILVADAMEAMLLSAREDNELPAAWLNLCAVAPADTGSYEELTPELAVTEDPTGTADPANAEDPAGTESADPADVDEDADRLGYVPVYTDPYLKKNSENYQWHHELLDSNSAWKAGYTGQGVRIAILDTGILAGHAEFKQKIKGMAYYQESGQNKGMVKADTLTDKDGNGTHLAGLIAAISGNGIGGCGIAPDAQLYIANIHDPKLGATTTDSLYYALQFVHKEWHPDILVVGTVFYGYSKLINEQINTLYEDGTAIFAPAGDDGSNQLVYPAGYTHAVSVAGVGLDNKPTDTTNTNTKVRYSGPARDVISTYKSSSTAYDMISGTPQAAACVAGAAALIAGSGNVSGSGAKRVDDLLAKLDAGCVKSGLGKGTPDLANCFHLRKSSEPPPGPTSSVESGVIDTPTLAVRLSSDSGTMIYYTLDGTTPLYKSDGTINGTQWKNTSTALTIPGDKKVLLKMIAVDTDSHLSSAVVTYTYEFRPPVETVTVTSEGNVKKIAKGTSLQLTGTALPAFAGNAKLRWDVVNAPRGVGVDKNGKVTVAKNCPVNSCLIRASATDGSNKYGDFDLIITDGAANALVKTIKPSATAITLTAGDPLTATGTVTVAVTLTDGTSGSAAATTTWYSKDEQIATVKQSGNYLSVTGVKLGKTTLIGVASDGSAKRSKIAVNVQQYVTNLSITGPKGNALQIGRSATLTALITPEKVTNKKLVWSMSSVPSTTTVAKCGVSINTKTGRVSAGRKAVPGTYRFRVTALDRGKITAKDYELKVTDNAISKVEFFQGETASYQDRIFRVTNAKGAKTQTSFDVKLTGGTASASAPLSCVTITNSNPKIVKMTASDSSRTVKLEATGNGTGTANITVKTNDGSGITKTFKVFVSNPPNRLHVNLPAGRSRFLAYGCTMKLVPVISCENGKLDASATKYRWSSSHPDLISVNPTSGVVTGRSEMGIKYSGVEAVTITCETTDGSNLLATFRLHPVGKTVRFTAEKLPDESGYAVVSIPKEAGSFVGTDYKAKVNAAGLGAYMQADPDDHSKATLHLYGQKKGTYTVTVSKMDGSAAVLRRKVVVNEHIDESGETIYTLTLK